MQSGRFLFVSSCLLLPALVAASLRGQSDPECPPQGFSSVDNFDLKTFISKRWHVQQQMEINNLPKSWNRCAFAQYHLKENQSFWGYDIDVYNYAVEVDSPHKPHNSSGTLCAKIVDGKTGKLKVAPCFLPTRFAGPYWVIDYNEAEGYAITSGGPPDIKSEGGCKTSNGTNNAGFWIFTRQQIRDEALVQKVRGIASGKGFDVSVLNDVDQTACAQQSLISEEM